MFKLENLQKSKLFWYLKKKLKLKSPDKIFFEKTTLSKLKQRTFFKTPAFLLLVSNKTTETFLDPSKYLQIFSALVPFPEAKIAILFIIQK